MTVFPSTDHFQRYLDGLGQFRMLLGLERMRASLQNLRLTPPRFSIVRVVGTNGKGASAWILARLAAAHGLRVGLYTSPHFLSPKERLMLLDERGPRMPEASQWLELANTVYAAGPAAPLDLVLQGQNDAGKRELAGLTYFEFLTAMALFWFQQEQVDLAVLEAGLGARFDATAALTAEMALLTPVGLDHEQIIGPGLAAIAAEKAHALKQGAALALSAPQQDVVWQEFLKAAQESQTGRRKTQLVPLAEAPSLVVEPREHLARCGGFIVDNTRLALAGWQLLARRHGLRPDPQRCAHALQEFRLPGRLQFVPPQEGEAPLLLDGAHNEHGLRALQETLQELGLRPQALVAGCMADKDLERIVPLLCGLTDGPLIFPELRDIPRAASAAELAARVQREGKQGLAAQDMARALELAQGACGQKGPEAAPVLVCGSLYLLGEFFKLRPGLVAFS